MGWAEGVYGWSGPRWGVPGGGPKAEPGQCPQGRGEAEMINGTPPLSDGSMKGSRCARTQVGGVQGEEWLGLPP